MITTRLLVSKSALDIGGWLNRADKIACRSILDGMFKRRLLLPTLVILATFALLQPAPSAQSTLKLPPAIDPQIVRDQDDMTWGDYVPIPGATWNDPAKAASVKTIRLAIVMADFE